LGVRIIPTDDFHDESGSLSQVCFQETAMSHTTQRRIGWVLSGLGAAFLLFDAAMKVLKVPQAVEGTTQLGYPESVIVPLGVLQLICLAVYLFPRTSVIGAILWTGYLGGAIATHVRLGNPLFTHVLFPIYVAAFLWGGLWLRNDRVRALVPWTRAI
jgi:DoxX-like family